MIPNFIKTIKQISWRRISQSEIRNSAAAEKSESESEGGASEQPSRPEKSLSFDWSGEWRIVAENQNKIPPAREPRTRASSVRDKLRERVPSSENSQCLTWSGWWDLNPRPQRPERCALANCATPRRACLV